MLAVSPGRTFQARIAVRCARAAGVRTVDIQAGTISRLRRFRAPSADIATCLDRSSWDSYHNHFGLPQERISITGSARIDALLRPVRNADQAAIRHEIMGEAAGEPLLFLATQPIEPDRMAVIASIAMSASAIGWRVILKPHPSEREQHIQTYQALRARAPRPDLIRIERDLDVYKVILASDVVATYFSTVGQEAFALGRKVLVIDPFEAPPDLDYVSTGLAQRVYDATSLATALSQGRNTAGRSEDPYLAVLQDGRAAERIWQTLRSGIALNPQAE